MDIKVEIDKLVELYQENSKHSNYQSLPDALQRLIGDRVFVKTRYEKERLRYIVDNLEIQDKFIIDIGGNSGYFTIELINKGAFLQYWEGNKKHAEFVGLAASILNISNRLTIVNDYYAFNEEKANYDIVLLLNVLHHIGDDFDNRQMTIEKARDSIIENLNRLAVSTSYVVFQLGYNWKGNRNYCLFKNGTKREMINFILNGVHDFYEVVKIGIPEMLNGKILYCDLNERNIKRDDSLGEFLNRPLFIIKSKAK